MEVFVGDVNDNKPEFDKSVYEARVDENVEEWTTIDLKLVVTDADVEVLEQSLHFFLWVNCTKFCPDVLGQ